MVALYYLHAWLWFFPRWQYLERKYLLIGILKCSLGIVFEARSLISPPLGIINDHSLLWGVLWNALDVESWQGILSRWRNTLLLGSFHEYLTECEFRRLRELILTHMTMWAYFAIHHLPVFVLWVRAILWKPLLPRIFDNIIQECVFTSVRLLVDWHLPGWAQQAFSVVIIWFSDFVPRDSKMLLFLSNKVLQAPIGLKFPPLFQVLCKCPYFFMIIRQHGVIEEGWLTIIAFNLPFGHFCWTSSLLQEVNIWVVHILGLQQFCVVSFFFVQEVVVPSSGQDCLRALV